jgi:hypothetical protein
MARNSGANPRRHMSRSNVTCVFSMPVIGETINIPLNNEELKIMLTEIERIFPTMCTNMKIDIDQIVTIRKSRSELFNEQYFTNKFWDIILLLYSHEINEQPIDAKTIASKLEISHASVMRYLQVLFADDIIADYEGAAGKSFDLECDHLSLTRLGFENAGSIIQQTRKVFGSTAQD